jgi:predicted chitinase
MTQEITAADLKRFAPRARPEYVTALLEGTEHLAAAGILDSPLRTAHFLAQCHAETGGFVVVRESLTYTTAKRLRQVWPARFRNKSDAQLRPLLRNGVALGDAVYAGRMGNKDPGDGFAYRGGGFLQTTGRYAVEKYAGKLGLTPSPALLDHIPTTLRFACIEWQESGCNECADENELVGVSKAINTGSATSSIRPVGLDARKAAFARAWSIWGEKGRPDTVPASPSVVTPTVVATGGGVGAATLIPAVPQAMTDNLGAAQGWQAVGTQVADLGGWALKSPMALAVVLVTGVGLWAVNRWRPS